jgi:hypothetical protein
MKKLWKNPFWENYQKDRITAKLNIQHPDGKVTSSTATISKFDRKGNINPDWDEIIAQNTIETIDKNTQERLNRHKQRHEEGKRAQKEREQAKKLESLFNAKLEVFEIDQVKNSKNRRLKAKIRKSKSEWEMAAYLSILIKEEYDAELSAEQPAETE